MNQKELTEKLIALGAFVTDEGDCFIPNDVQIPPEIAAHLKFGIQPPAISPNLHCPIEKPRIFELPIGD